MAEFSEVMREWNRMCNAVPGKSECVSICRDIQSGYTCPMHDSGLCNKSLSSQTEKDRLEGEKTIMSWAAEHPEPVYPTWFEYLVKERILVPREKYTKYDLWNLLISQLKNTPISADIAQKLGVEPKEAT